VATRIDRIAAMLQHIGADLRGDLLLRNHHGRVFGGDGMNRIGGGGRVKGAALLLCACRQAARQIRRLSQISGWFGLRERSSKIRELEPVGVIENAKGLSQHGLPIWFRCCSKNRLLGLVRDISGMANGSFDAGSAGLQRIYPRRAAVISGFSSIGPPQPYFTLITNLRVRALFHHHVDRIPASGQALWGFAKKNGRPRFDDRPDVAGAGRDRGRQWAAASRDRGVRRAAGDRLPA